MIPKKADKTGWKAIWGVGVRFCFSWNFDKTSWCKFDWIMKAEWFEEKQNDFECKFGLNDEYQVRFEGIIYTLKIIRSFAETSRDQKLTVSSYFFWLKLKQFRKTFD